MRELKNNLSVNEKGVTLVALTVTIIVLLVLAGISLIYALGDDNIVKEAKEVKDKTEGAIEKEQEDVNEMRTMLKEYLLGGLTEERIKDFTENPDKYTHADQASSKKDRALGTDGKPVNLDLWQYFKTDDGTGVRLGLAMTTSYDLGVDKKGYIGSIVDGKIQGTVPQYIYLADESKTYEVKSLEYTFAEENELIEGPTLPTTVYYLWGTFYMCTNLEKVTIPDSITIIENYTFGKCTNLPSISIPNSVTSIGRAAFGYCTNLTSISIPNSVTSIGHSVFSNCTSLQSINIPNSVTNIGEYAFYYCTGLQSINIPNNVTNIGWHAFSNCTSLQSINIPNSVTSIGRNAFATWTSSQVINCQAPSKPTGWDNYWNSDCNATINWSVNM